MLVGADVFIGVSAPGTVTTEMVKTMNKDAIVFACANPTPEIFPEDAKAGGAKVISTGRSDYPNQIDNVLAFPGIFRGAFDVRASDINEEMKVAAAHALAALISEERALGGLYHPQGLRPPRRPRRRQGSRRSREKNRRGEEMNKAAPMFHFHWYNPGRYVKHFRFFVEKQPISF